MKTNFFSFFITSFDLQKLGLKNSLKVNRSALALVALFCGIGFTSSSQAREDYELQTHLTRGSFGTQKVGDSTVTLLEAQASMAKFIRGPWQAGAEVGLTNSSGGGRSYSAIQVVGFGAYNFTSSVMQSLYAKAGVGLYDTINDRGDHENKVGLFVGGGKRFPVWNQITYTPEVRLLKIGSQDITFQAYILNFSVFF